MKHLKKLSILALLLTAAVQGAWAQTVELKPFTVPDTWNGDETAVTAADLPNDFGAVSLDVAKQITIPNAPSDEIEVVIYGISDDQKLMEIDLSEGRYAGNTIVTKKKIYEKLTWGYKIYYTVAQPTPAAQPIDLTEVTAGKEWKIEAMPAGNVELQVEYEPEYSATFKALTANTIGTAATVKLDNVAIDTLTAEKNTLNGIYPGQTVTLTAQPGYKFRKVEAKEGAAGPVTLAESTVGMIVGSDGMAYPADYERPSGVFLAAVVAYKDGSNGLAITDLDQGGNEITDTWANQKSACEGNTAITGGTWRMPSEDDWKQMFTANGGSESSYTGLNAIITAAGGHALNGTYWTSTETTGGAKIFHPDNGTADFRGANKDAYNLARAVLAF